MKVIVVGGGKVGYYLTKTLLEHGHEPVVIEPSRYVCEKLSNELEINCICADGSTIDAQEAAGADSSCALVAVTGQDEANLVACQVAKRVFSMKKTIARVNDPKNLPVMKKLGVDIPISSTDTLANRLEREVSVSAIKQVLQLDEEDASINQIVIPKDSVLHGKPISEIALPDDCIIISISRDNSLIIPRGRTVLNVGDEILLLATNTAIPKLLKVFDLSDEQTA